MTSFWNNQIKKSYDYLLPAARQTDGIDLQIPHAYQMIISGFVALSYKATSSQESPRLPTLDLSFSYLDIADNRHYANFALHVELEVVAGGGEYFHAELIPTRAA